MRAAKHPAYTRDAGWRGFPTRDAAATAQQIDLTAFYNATLDTALAGSDAKSLGGMSKGVGVFDGVRFDVRGIVALSKGKNQQANRPFPARVETITIGRMDPVEEPETSSGGADSTGSGTGTGTGTGTGG